MSSLTPFLHQRPMQKAPPLQRDVQSRADEGAIRTQTGRSGPAAPPGHRHIHYSQHGDDRSVNFHSGSANTSAVPSTPPGVPIHNGRNGNGPNAA